MSGSFYFFLRLITSSPADALKRRTLFSLAAIPGAAILGVLSTDSRAHSTVTLASAEPLVAIQIFSGEFWKLFEVA